MRNPSSMNWVKPHNEGITVSKEKFDFTSAKQGALVPADPTKTRITIRLDIDVLNWFRNQVHEAGGGNYQTLITEALCQYIQRASTISREQQ